MTPDQHNTMDVVLDITYQPKIAAKVAMSLANKWGIKEIFPDGLIFEWLFSLFLHPQTNYIFFASGDKFPSYPSGEGI